MIGVAATARLWVVAWLITATTASADPWRAALDVELNGLVSAAEGSSPRLTATGMGIHLRGERRLDRCWWVVAGADAGITGPVVSDRVRIDDSTLAVLGFAIGLASELGERWRWRGLIGPSRVFYLSPRVIGDSGWDLGLAAEAVRLLTERRAVSVGISARLATSLGEDGGAMRATTMLSLGLEVVVGR